uniref:Uncharacterized protein n=1 Tax=Glossina pallidipes TaxID=7398 RepID=A0A1B0A721_GLOPL
MFTSRQQNRPACALCNSVWLYSLLLLAKVIFILNAIKNIRFNKDKPFVGQWDFLVECMNINQTSNIPTNRTNYNPFMETRRSEFTNVLKTTKKSKAKKRGKTKTIRTTPTATTISTTISTIHDAFLVFMVAVVLVLVVVVVVVMLFFSMASNKIHARMCHIFKKPPAYLSALRLHLTLIINVHKVEKVSLSTLGFSAIVK